MKKTNTKMSTQTMVLGAVLTALVVILQLMGGFIRLGMFQISLVLLPIVIGAATCGIGVGAWLGFVFGMVVLLNGDAAPFLAVSVPGTIITVLAKGIACGLTAGIVYKALEKFNRYAAVIAAAIVCPIVNTGVFLLGCLVFFMNTIREWGVAEGYTNVVGYMFLGLVGGNFLVELASNIILSPAIVKLLNIRKK
jgi:uncharacterized membrane protein